MQLTLAILENMNGGHLGGCLIIILEIHSKLGP